MQTGKIRSMAAASAKVVDFRPRLAVEAERLRSGLRQRACQARAQQLSDVFRIHPMRRNISVLGVPGEIRPRLMHHVELSFQ